MKRHTAQWVLKFYFRYPGIRATTRRMQAALRQVKRARTELRSRLGLSP
jgi:hypothetical protein